MVEVLIALGLILVVALIVAIRGAKRRHRANPNDIYPHW